MNFSVLLATYCNDCPEWLNAAMESIWNDQELKPTEIVLVKDGPLPAKLEAVVDFWKGKLGTCLTVVRLPYNKGLAAALNAGLKHCKYDLVARMDSDDISLPSRFAKQVEFMKKHPECSVVSSWVKEMDQEMQQCRFLKKLPEAHDDILKFAKLRSPVSHPAVMMRKNDALGCGGYPQIYPEDYPLWSTMLSRGAKFANLPEVLLLMRTGDDFLSRRGLRFFLGEVRVLRHQRRIHFISRLEFAFKFCLLAVLRLSPLCFKLLAYSKMRGWNIATEFGCKSGTE